MGENLRKGQCEAFKKGTDLAMIQMSSPSLIQRPDLELFRHDADLLEGSCLKRDANFRRCKMSNSGKDFDRLVESAYDLARAIRKGRKETSDVMIPIAFEEIRLSVEDLFEKIENQRALIQILIKAIDAMGKCNDASK